MSVIGAIIGLLFLVFLVFLLLPLLIELLLYAGILLFVFWCLKQLAVLLGI